MPVALASPEASNKASPEELTRALDFAQGFCERRDYCHPGTSSGNFIPGYLLASLATLAKTKPTITQPKTCAFCHNDAMPTGFVGPAASKRTPASGPMKHDAVTWANGKPTTTILVSKECGLCHASSAGGSDESWATGRVGGITVYHASLGAAGQSQPSSCVDCHANSTSTGTTNSTTPTSAQTGTPTGIPGPVTTGSAYSSAWRFDHNERRMQRSTCNMCHGSPNNLPED